MHIQRHGLRAKILRGQFVASRGGYSDGDIHEVYIVGESIPPAYPVPEGAPTLTLTETTPGYTAARPDQGGGYMASGAYIVHSGCWEEWGQVFGHHLPIPLHDRSESMINLQYIGPGTLYRGETELPHQSQVLRRDLHGEQIQKAPGARALGCVRPDSDEEWVKHVWNNPYNFVVKAPGQAATSWTAFRTEEELRAFAAAYALDIEGSLDAGGQFELIMPDTIGRWLPVTVKKD